MATITWSITNITILPQADGFTDFAWQVSWTCSASEGANTKTMGSGISFSPEQQGGSYTPYDQLTEAQVIEWVKQGLGPDLVAKTEEGLTNMLTAQIAPLPWSN